MERSPDSSSDWYESLPNQANYQSDLESDLWGRAQVAGPDHVETYFGKLLKTDIARQQAEAGLDDSGEAIERYRELAEELREYESQVLPDPPDKTAPGE